MAPSLSDAYMDVEQLCAFLKCLGFSIKSMDTTEGNVSQDGGSGTSVINCRECGSSLLGSFSLPQNHRERLTKELQDIVQCIKELNESDVEKKREPLANKSASMLDLKTPEKRLQLKSKMPTRSLSQDALTAKDDQLPAPGPLAKDDYKKFVYQRQRTFTLSPTPETSIIRNKTSSPIQVPLQSVIDSLVAAEKNADDLRNKLSNIIFLRFSPIQVPLQSVIDSLVAAEKNADDLRNKLSNIIRDITKEGKHDSSFSSLDVSKISVLKGTDGSKVKSASSPNLSGVGGVQDNYIKRSKPLESVSTSKLASKSTDKEGKLAKLKRVTNVFHFKTPSTLNKKNKSQDIEASNLNNLPKPQTVKPVRENCNNSEGSINLSASKKKFSHVKSTIPRLPKKTE